NRNTNNTFCDRGAIEIEVPTTISLIGEDLIAGQVAKLSVADLLGDSDLLSKTECASLFKSAKAPNGEEWQPGCMRVQQTQTVSKGKVA
ncbi:rhombotarget A, partial [bacterium LRH843]|nr:rhombotarget A [bacterium LRH843]